MFKAVCSISFITMFANIGDKGEPMGQSKIVYNEHQHVINLESLNHKFCLMW